MADLPPVDIEVSIKNGITNILRVRGKIYLRSGTIAGAWWRVVASSKNRSLYGCFSPTAQRGMLGFRHNRSYVFFVLVRNVG